jgi:BolA protein
MSVQQAIESKLGSALSPSHLEVVNESGNHNVPKGSESHFKVVLVSDAFEGRPMLTRHRMVYAALAQELAGPVHALALHTYTPAQWRALDGSAPSSPACRGGKALEAGAG